MHDATVLLPTLTELTPKQRVFFGYLAEREGPTREMYEYHLNRWFQWCDDQRLDPMTVERTHVAMYVRYLHEACGLKGSTVNSYCTPVKGFYSHAFHEGEIPRDPAANVKMPKVHYGKKPPLERSELRAISKAGREIGGRHWALTDLLMAMALRISECTWIQIENYQETERGHRVLKFRRKGGRWETKPIPVAVLMALDDAAAGRTEGPLLVAIDGQPLHRSSATGLLNTVVRRAGIGKTVNPHWIRSSVITDALEHGATLRDAQHLAGHLDPRTTAIYDLGEYNHDNNPVHVQAARLLS